MTKTRQLRDVFGHFATGVTIVTATDEQGAPFGMTANSFTSVSLEPPLVLWNVGRDAWCYERFLAATHFAIHMLDEAGEELSDHFARKNAEKFDAIDWRPGADGVPDILNCSARLHCKTTEQIAAGDHTILLAEVVSFEARSNAPPLMFHRGRYRRF